MFIANLCLIDLLTASTMLPLNVASYALGNMVRAYKRAKLRRLSLRPSCVLNRNHRYWPLQSISYSCELQAFYYYCCGYTSIVCLMAISVNRLVGICMPTYYDRGNTCFGSIRLYLVFNSVFSKQKVKCGLIVTWLFAPSLLLPFFFNKGFKWVGTW